MKHFLRLALFIALLFGPVPAFAATCFWVGGTGNFDSVNIVSWSSSSGGSGSTCAATGNIPKNVADIATFDAASGGGTVTVCGALSSTCPSATGSLSINRITMGAFTGTLDFSAINPNVTLAAAFSGTGAGTRTLNMGSGTWTLSGANSTVWDCTTCDASMTLSAASSTIVVSASATNSRTLALGTSKTYGTITLVNSGNNVQTLDLSGTTGVTIATLNITAPIAVRLTSSITYTITNALALTGTAFNSTIQIEANSGITPTLALTASGTCSWCVLGGITFSTSTLTATNSIDAKGNSGTVTITGPATGTGGGIIGG